MSAAGSTENSLQQTVLARVTPIFVLLAFSTAVEPVRARCNCIDASYTNNYGVCQCETLPNWLLWQLQSSPHFRVKGLVLGRESREWVVGTHEGMERN